MNAGRKIGAAVAGLSLMASGLLVSAGPANAAPSQAPASLAPAATLFSAGYTSNRGGKSWQEVTPRKGKIIRVRTKPTTASVSHRVLPRYGAVLTGKKSGSWVQVVWNLGTRKKPVLFKGWIKKDTRYMYFDWVYGSGYGW